MGNYQLVSAFKRANYISIEDKGVMFFDGKLVAESIFQRHAFQMFKVRPAEMTMAQPESYYLRVINTLDNDESFAIIEHMQTMLIHVKHPNLVQYKAIKVEQESPQIKFLILEEDLGDNAVTLKNLCEALKQPQNHLLAVYFSDRIFLY